MSLSGPPEPTATESASAPRRNETDVQRLDRNWLSLLQELRVTQTGTQIVGGFLLALAFQPRFTELDLYQLTVYLILVATATTTTVLALGPVSLHRLLFGKHAMKQIVRVADVLVRATLVGVAVILAGTTLLVFDVVLGRTAGQVAGAAVLLVIVAVWLVLPRRAKR
ncbi:sodium:proton antiporter [Cryobacterium sp. TMT1-19]|uniref:DUF6328 family protein n=1 Tax=Cryobacterium sp. TMT1-19 TaxID=1259231 RepID=UPI00106D5954|nr:DUF6328 family protein [Cryobacterium sp. TMT1-19]TFD31820.1 sodium:proton antiporter [Cryobacterium sp. TMT1-19]